jgi:hypothetical protein
MIKHFLLFASLILSMQVIAQTGIGTPTPDASARLEVAATNKGFLPPRVTLSNVTDATTIPTPATGLLVYNLGSVGLQAGYYYWNGANWATIATGTTAGNAVVASDLVKLYQEVYSTALNKASSTGGFSFTVPVSGRYEFNFNCTGWNSNGERVKLTFNIRQGTTILESDYHESFSSNAWVEYEGRLEVNLTAGVTYNAQVVTTTGLRGTKDWDKIMYKMVAGNLPVNQHMAERNLQLNNNFISNDGGNEGIRIDNSGNVGIGTSSPTEKLEVSGNVKANNFIGTASSRILYLLEASASVTYTLPGTYANDICRYSIVNNTVNMSSSWFNTSNYRFTPQKAGYWEITASYDIYRNSESSLTIQKNSTNVAVNGTISSVVQQVTKIVYLNGSTDFITIANSGFNSNARSQTSSSSWFQARWVGE